MPWTLKDATKKASSPSKKKKWAAVLKKSGDDAKAVRIDNASVKHGRRSTP